MMYRIRSLVLAMLMGFTAYAQDCNNFSLTVSEDTTLCATGEAIPLSAEFTIPPFALEWSPATGLADPLSAATTATVDATTTYTVMAQAIGDNLIFNGDFELGAVGFTTDYNTASGGPNGPLHNEGEYQISDNPNATHEDFAACPDHTSGNGQMMVVNSSDQQDDVWCQVVSVQPMTDYAFSAWVASVIEENPAVLQFSFDGMLLGSPINALPLTCQWSQFAQTWNSGNATDVEICIANVNDESSGNDFALDDIRFGPICEVTDSVTVALGEAPAPVAMATCEAGANELLLSWEPVAGAAGYVLDVLDGPAGQFTTDTSYIIEGLMPGQQVNYELFAQSVEGCLSPPYSGSCTTPECPSYELAILGDTAICEGAPLELAIQLTTDSEGPFTLTYQMGGSSDTLFALQSGENTYSLPVAASGTLAFTAFTDSSHPNCSYGGGLPEVEVAVATAPEAGVGQQASFCAQTDTALTLGSLLSGAGEGGTWSLTNASLPPAVFDPETAELLVGQVPEAGTLSFAYVLPSAVCGNDTAVVGISILALPAAEAGGPFTLDCNTEAVVLGSPATEGLQYNWESLGGGVIAEPTAAMPEVSRPGAFRLLVTDIVTGCSRADSATVTDERTLPQPQVSIQNSSCDGAEEGRITVDSVRDGSPPFVYSLDGAQFVQAPVFNNLAAGSYTVYVEDNGGCTGQVTVTLDSPEPANLQLLDENGNPDPVITQADTLQLYLETGLPAENLDTIIWRPSACVGCADPKVAPTRTTLYQAEVQTVEGCFYTASIRVRVEERQRLFAPTAFSPNEDGVNDRFFAYAGPEFVRGVQLQIYNRWGSRVFERSGFALGDPAAGWDGQFRGEPAPPGVYGYYLVVERSDGTLFQVSGELHLVY